jgi:carboxyl-terminal processing protease
MMREGSAKPLTFDLMRDEIPEKSVDLAFMIRPGIGYIRITGEMETTSNEVQHALDKFGPNLQGLLIDLRGNPGGLLNQAVDVCDKFLKKGDIVVSQRARKGVFPDQVYTRSERIEYEVSDRGAGGSEYGVGCGDYFGRAAGP